MHESLVKDFEENGFVKIEDAFSQELAAACREILWNDLPVDRYDPSTWIQPVIRLNGYAHEPFRLAANTPVLHEAFDRLVGAGRWNALKGLGTFPIRFPSELDSGDTGWHADASFAGEDGSWRINVTSTGRALLMLFLFSDIGVDDAPTRILVGSHLDIPPLLSPAGEKGLSFIELAQKFTPASLARPLALATGKAGTVYLCHPFLIHAAQPHRGSSPRFLAQPPLVGSIDITRPDHNYSPVEIAIRKGLGKDASGL